MSLYNLADYIKQPAEDELRWQERAACAQAYYGDLFFPEVGPEMGRRIEHAKTLCRNCDVRQDCLEYATSNHISDGIWGGVDFGRMEPEPDSCRRGHPYPGNVRLDARGHRRCRACDREQKRKERRSA